MKKLIKFNSGSVYVLGGITDIYPDKTPDEEYDLGSLTKEEFLELKRNPKDKKLFDKVKKFKIK